MIPGNTPQAFFGAAANAAAAGGYSVDWSLRFNSADSANLSRNFGGTSTDRKLQTISFWVKRTVFATRQILFTTYDGSSSQEWRIFFETSDILRFQFGGSSTFLLDTTQVFRDPSAWYHILYSVDTTQATDSNRVKLYVNGNQVTAFNTAAYPSQNNTSQFPSANTNNRIGSNYDASGNFANVYLADIYFIDGSALTPTSFGEFDATTGVWVPIEPDGLVYGTNGFHLDFADTSASTATALGKDTSGNGNNWTPNNFTVIGYTAPSSATISSVSTESLAVTTYQARRGSGSRTGTPPQSWSTATNMGDQTINVGSNFNPSAPGVINWGSGDWLYFKLNTSSVALIGLLTTGNGPMRLYGSSDGSSWTLVYAGDNGSRLAQSTTPYEYYAWCMQDQVVAANDYGVNGPRTLVTVSANTNLTKFNLVNYVTQSNSGATGYIATLDTNSFIFGLLFTTGTWASNGTNTVIGPSTLNTTGAVDTLRDSPTNGTQSDTGVGGEVVGNYCTINPLTSPGSAYLSITNGNLDQLSLVESTASSKGTIGVSSGKWYWEVQLNILSSGGVSPRIGICRQSAPAFSQAYGSDEWVLFMTDYPGFGGTGGHNSTFVGVQSLFSNGDIGMFALDMDNSKIYFGKNGTWLNSGNPASGTGAFFTDVTGEIFPLINTGYFTSVSCNFGQRAFAYTAPSGFKALCTANLTAPTIVKPSTVFDVKTYTGNGSTQTISGLGFSPDLVWLKNRATGDHNGLFDTQRGALYRLVSDYGYASTLRANTLTAFNSDGFSVGSASEYNGSTNGIVAWAWEENISCGFDIVTFTGNGSNRTVSHSLGVAPSLILVKDTSSGTNFGAVYHSSVGNTAYLKLFDDASGSAASTTDSTVWNNTSPTSSVFSVGTSSRVNANGNTIIAYCWAPVAGYSAFGSYTGNGSSDGPFVYTGFRPRWLMIKRTDDVLSWLIVDAARDSFNTVGVTLFANTSSEEADKTYGYTTMDFLSNGFKLRTTGISNTSSATYVWAAFAESPFGLNNRAR